LDRPGRKADFLCRTDEANQIRPVVVGAGTAPQLLKIDRHGVVQRDGRERSRTAIAWVVLPDVGEGAVHAGLGRGRQG
jgi:hypothetical protein